MAMLPQPDMAAITNSSRVLLDEIPKLANIPALQGANAILEAINALGERVDAIGGRVDALTTRVVAAYVQRGPRPASTNSIL